MNSIPPHTTSEDAKLGLMAGIMAYTFWGAFPIYFKITEVVSPLEILAHRIVWSLPFALIIIVIRRQWPELKRALRLPKLVGLLALAAIALSVNWGVYIWAVQNEQIFQGSLGYFINPLMYVLVGVLFFGEKLTKLQFVSVILALIGVSILTLYGGVFPYISLILATSFATYGVIRKQAVVGAIPGLVIETGLLFIPAAAFLFWLHIQGTLSFGTSPSITGLLLLAGPVTVLPLWAFAIAARKLKLSTLGMLQYIGPTGQFICALYYGEAFTTAHAWCFGFIWVGILIYSFDAYRGRPKHIN
ncbi:EamA family transporter RarD [Hellea balneolensis]|uniref:EamA family transporter RarD n=1 Tax=Hellea balneolensis TaxID=287478 RepID=UPI0004217355|nr:EamA family transporter RarD [Hellea balneolensis]